MAVAAFPFVNGGRCQVMRRTTKCAAEQALEEAGVEIVCAAPVLFTRTPKDPVMSVAAGRAAAEALRGLVARARGAEPSSAADVRDGKRRVLAVVRPSGGSKASVDDLLLLLYEGKGAGEHKPTTKKRRLEDRQKTPWPVAKPTLVTDESGTGYESEDDEAAHPAAVDTSGLRVDPQMREPPTAWFEGVRALVGGMSSWRSHLLTASSVVVSHVKADTGRLVPRAFTITPTGNADAPFPARRWRTPAFTVAVDEGPEGDALVAYLEREVVSCGDDFRAAVAAARSTKQ